MGALHGGHGFEGEGDADAQGGGPCGYKQRDGRAGSSVSSAGLPSCPCGSFPWVQAERPSSSRPPASAADDSAPGAGRLLMSVHISSCLALPLLLSLHFSEMGGGRENAGVPPLFTGKGGGTRCGLQGPVLPLPSYATQASP